MATKGPAEPGQGTLDLFAPRHVPAPAPAVGERAAPTQPARAAMQHHSAAAQAAPRSGALPTDDDGARPPPPTTPPPPAAMQQTAPLREPPPGPRVYSVSQVVQQAARTLEARFGDVWVEGEVSNLRATGHVYFTLKDDVAQLAAVLWRSDAQRLKFRLVDGLHVRVRGRLTIYDGQGKFQMSVTAVEPVGLGALQLAFEQLKRKLEAEGLFARERKRPLPFLPRRIGVATSATGAAVRDIVRVALRRGPARIVIAPCQVQGEAAPGEIVRALGWLERQRDVDVIIVGRGGGSAEDLQAFNDEAVARAIARCRVPVISAVGHEVDYTIADFVADQRAATPSQAAELAVPVHAELGRRLHDLDARLRRAGRRAPADARQRLDELRDRGALALRRSIDARRAAVEGARGRLAALHPRVRLLGDRAALEKLSNRLGRAIGERVARRERALGELERRVRAAMQQAMERRQRAFAAAAGKLGALSPLAVLDRGYALVRRAGGAVVRRARDVAPGEPLTVRLAEGALAVRVERATPDDASPTPAGVVRIERTTPPDGSPASPDPPGGVVRIERTTPPDGSPASPDPPSGVLRTERATPPDGSPASGDPPGGAGRGER